AVSPLSLIGRVGSQRRAPRSPVFRPPLPTVLCCVPNLPLTSGVVARTHRKGKAQRGFRPGQGDDDGHDNPAEARTTYRPLAAGEGTIAVMSTLADFGSPTPFQRFV